MQVIHYIIEIVKPGAKVGSGIWKLGARADPKNSLYSSMLYGWTEFVLK